jgi:RNA polymerase sigma-70 factor (ECF subfamily)
MTDNGEKKAWFGQCVEEHMDALYRLALRLTRNEMDAEDLVADAVTRAWCAIDSLQDRSRSKPWMFRILHNCFISNYRKKSIRPQETTYDECSGNTGPIAEGDGEISELLIRQSNEFMHWWANPEQEFANQLLGDDIMSAIEELPESYKVTVLLVNVEGFSYDDAADVLDVPAGTIRSRMKRGRTLLQKALWQQAIDAGIIEYASV